MNRRAAVSTLSTSAFVLAPLISNAASPSKETMLLDELRAVRAALDPLPALLDEEKWDAVRSVLKLPPVGNRKFIILLKSEHLVHKPIPVHCEQFGIWERVRTPSANLRIYATM